MKVASRAVAVSVLLSLAWAGPLAPLAMPLSSLIAVQNSLDAFLAAQRTCRVGTIGVDGSPHVSAVWFVWHDLALWVYSIVRSQRCVFAFSTIVFAGSFAARPDASMGILDEACGSKAHWIIRGEDIRTRPSATKAFEWETHRFQWER